MKTAKEIDDAIQNATVRMEATTQVNMDEVMQILSDIVAILRKLEANQRLIVQPPAGYQFGEKGELIPFKNRE